MSGSIDTSDTSAQLASLIAQIQALGSQIPNDIETNSTSAANFQQALAAIESNSDPNNPGLEQIFIAQNNAILEQTAAINNAVAPNIPTINQVSDLATPLHDCWAAWQIEQYLLRLSAEIGYPGPAQQFIPIIQQVNQRPFPAPILPPVPAPPPTPPPSGGPPPSPIIVPPGPTPTPPGGTPPSPPPTSSQGHCQHRQC